MKRVPLNIAKILKEAGYPQGWECDKHYCLESEGEYGYQIGDLVSADTVHKNCLEAVSAPTYLEVWLWLWREKGLKIFHDVRCDVCFICREELSSTDKIYSKSYSDPEAAIIEAIEYLVDNDLIK